MTTLRYIAEAAEARSDIFTALGIDWRLLILQIIAFLILVFLLGKFVFPWLIKSVDDRQKSIEEAAAAAAKAQRAAEENQEAVARLLSDARKEAAEIVSTAKLESSEIISESEKKAQKSAERIVADAREQLGKDVENARRELHDETLELVSLATSKVVAGTLDKKVDNELIAKQLKEAK